MVDKVQWKRGTRLEMVMAVTSGTVTGSETVRAVLKRAVRGSDAPGDAAADALEFTVTFAAEDVDGPDRWTIVGSDSDSAGLTTGLYACDIRFDAGTGAVTQSPTFLVEIVERVTEAS